MLMYYKLHKDELLKTISKTKELYQAFLLKTSKETEEMKESQTIYLNI